MLNSLINESTAIFTIAYNLWETIRVADRTCFENREVFAIAAKLSLSVITLKKNKDVER